MEFGTSAQHENQAMLSLVLPLVTKQISCLQKELPTFFQTTMILKVFLQLWQRLHNNSEHTGRRLVFIATAQFEAASTPHAKSAFSNERNCQCIGDNRDLKGFIGFSFLAGQSYPIIWQSL
jgi:hypothetical protein